MTDTAARELTFADDASRVAWEEFASQGAIPPGTPGWWQRMGAIAREIRAGDLFLCQHSDGTQEANLVAELVDSSCPMLSQGFLTTDGKRWRLGKLTPIVLLRRGTHHTLSDYCR